MALTFGRPQIQTNGSGTVQDNGAFSLTVIGDGESSDIFVDLSQSPFAMNLGGLVPQDVVVTAFGNQGGTMEVNPNDPMQLGIHVNPGPTGNPMTPGQLVDVAGFLTFDGIVPTPPTVTSLTPTTGSVLGGTVVTITGTGFLNATGVKFGPVPALSFTVVSNTQITAVAPPRAAGMVDVTVTTPFGTTATVAGDQFTFA